MLKSDIAVGIFLLIVGILFFAGSFDIVQSTISAPLAGASFFPRILSILLVLSSIYLIIKDIFRRTKVKSKKSNSSESEVAVNKEDVKVKEKAVLIMFLATTVYVLISPIIGFFTTTIIFMIFTSLYFGKILGRKRWPLTVGFVLGITIVAYILFTYVLSVFLPSGLLI